VMSLSILPFPLAAIHSARRNIQGNREACAHSEEQRDTVCIDTPSPPREHTGARPYTEGGFTEVIIWNVNIYIYIQCAYIYIYIYSSGMMLSGSVRD